MILFGCDPLPSDSCEDPIPCESATGPTYYYEDSSTSYYAPIFNPNNLDEMIVMRVFRPSIGTEIVTVLKYNYITQVSQTILSNSVLQTNNISFCRFNWSTNGWVVFENCSNGQLYKIHDDGTGLQQITFDGGSFYPNFSYDGDRIFFSDNSIALGQHVGMIMDINTNVVLDTIFDPSYIGSYYFPTFLSNDKIITAKQDNYIRIIDANGLILLDQFYPQLIPTTISNFLYFRNIGSNANEIFFIIAYKGIFKFNLNTRTAYLVRRSCTKEQISTISISNDGAKVIYELDKYSYDTEPCLVKVQSEVHLMNIDGSNDQIITFP
jgi:hypothetical protein